MDLGFERAGFDVRLAIDLDDAARKTYEAHHNGTVLPGDLSRMSAKQIGDEWDKISREPPIGIIGGPPCQYFSAANRHSKEDDPRRDLPRHYAEIIRGLNRRYGLYFFVFENVVGLTQTAHKDDYASFLALFEGAGFRCFKQVLDAQHFGVPQIRPRVFVVGLNPAKWDRGCDFQPPGATRKKPLTVASVLNRVRRPPRFFERGLTPEELAKDYHPNHWTMQPRSKKFKEKTLTDWATKARSFRVLDRSKPSWTVAYGHREIHVHPDGKRRVSVLEAMLFQGFDKEYVLHGNLSEQVRQVSDAVPPPLAEAVARAVAVSLHSASTPQMNLEAERLLMEAAVDKPVVQIMLEGETVEAATQAFKVAGRKLGLRVDVRADGSHHLFVKAVPRRPRNSRRKEPPALAA